MGVKIGVKYCGGCNPNYDRKEVVDTIEKQLGIDIAPYSRDEIPDVTLVICGCTAECINTNEYKGKRETLVINSSKQVDEIIKLIRALN